MSEVPMEPIIRVDNLTKHYTTYSRGNSFAETVKSLFVRKPETITAVNNISFEVPQGSIMALIGPNGAGKSTTVKMLTGVLFPSSGDISVMGYTPWKQRVKYVANIGAVFGQKSQLIWDIPPIDSIYMNKAIYGIPNAVFNKNLDTMADLFEIGDIIKKPTRNLSLGERMKCEFIMAMLHNPRIVFLDEPTIGLDIIAKDKIREFILEMNRKGTTFILTTHDIGDIEKLAESVIVINHGEIIFSDSLPALKNHLGAIKTVRVLTKSGKEETFSIDTDKTDISSFISSLSEMGDLADISISEMAIENVIKSLY